MSVQGLSAYAMFCKANPTGGNLGTARDTHATKLVSSPPDELWATVIAGVPSTSVGGTLSPYFTSLSKAGLLFAQEPIYLANVGRTSSLQWYIDVNGHLDTDGSPTYSALKWYVLELHYDRSVRSDATVSCDTTISVTSTRSEVVDQFRIGQDQPLVGFFQEGLLPPLPNGCWIARASLGSTRFGIDIFDDNFASGDFSAWDAHTTWTGTPGVISPGFGCTIAANPGYADFDLSCVPFFPPERRGVYLPPITEPYGADYVQP